MKHHPVVHILLPFLFLLVILTGCRTTAPSLDYGALARASIRLGIDIGPKDNHQLYLTASTWIGVPYRNGGNSKRGIDCSGFTQKLYKEVFHLRLPHSTSQQQQITHHVNRHHLREGDLVFFCNGNTKRVSHVGIYLKSNKFIHASSSRGVMVSSLNEPYWKACWLHGGRFK